MNTDAKNASSPETAGHVDLSSLENFSFGTAWDKGSREHEASSVKKKPAFGQKKTYKKRESSQDQPDFKRKSVKDSFKKKVISPFVPVYSVSFYPEQRSLDVILSALRKSKRAYKLFSVAQLMLQKTERLSVCIEPLKKEGETRFQGPFYQCKLDGVPFDSEKSVVYHAFKYHCSSFFKTESVSVDLPQGAFKIIARCSLTQKLLAPPNYHRYEAILRQHHAEHCPHLSWDRFLSSVEMLEDKDLLKDWMDSMGQETHYTTVEIRDGEKAQVFRYEQDAINYLLLNKKDQIVDKKSKVNFGAQHITKMPLGPMRQSVEVVLRQQRRFPLETSKVLIPLLRKARFFLFKTGSRKVTYVTTIKRKRLDPAVPMSGSVSALVSTISGMRDCTREKLLEVLSKSSKSEALSRDLNWLISEGYVVEYEEGVLDVVTPLTQDEEPEAREKSQKLISSSSSPNTPMLIHPKIRGFVCVTAHPKGCAAHVQDQSLRLNGLDSHSGPKKVLVLGCSTGYGLSSRITAAFGYQADTLGVSFERPPSQQKPASAGWYNNWAFEQKAHEQGLYAQTLNGDAFSKEIKEEVLALIAEHMGQVDLVIYSLAAPRRTDPDTQEVYKSVLKPVGQSFEGKSLDTDRGRVTTVNLEPASDEEVEATQKVMGGEDWALWIDALMQAKLLAPGVRTVAYSYIGPEVTFPIYKNGTIGLAKKHLEETAQHLQAKMATLGGHAWVSINKCIVTQASSAIPVVPLYASILYKVMKEKGIHEDSLDQIKRLFSTHLYAPGGPSLDEEGRIRMDDLELREDVQETVAALWPQVTTETLSTLSDYAGYQEAFLQLFGFNWPGVDYDQPVSCAPEPEMASCGV